jgi:hypothetical protein
MAKCFAVVANLDIPENSPVPDGSAAEAKLAKTKLIRNIIWRYV